MCAVIVLWLIVIGDHGQYLAGQRMNWLVVTLMKISQRKCFITIHEALLHNILARPSLAETQFWVEVKRLKCVKYELGKISSSVDTPPLCDLIEILSPGPSEGVQTTRRYRVWESILAICWSHTRTASPHVCTTFYVVGFWLLATWGSVGSYQQPWAVVL